MNGKVRILNWKTACWSGGSAFGRVRWRRRLRFEVGSGLLLNAVRRVRVVRIHRLQRVRLRAGHGRAAGLGAGWPALRRVVVHVLMRQQKRHDLVAVRAGLSVLRHVRVDHLLRRRRVRAVRLAARLLWLRLRLLTGGDRHALRARLRTVRVSVVVVNRTGRRTGMAVRRAGVRRRLLLRDRHEVRRDLDGAHVGHFEEKQEERSVYMESMVRRAFYYFLCLCYTQLYEPLEITSNSAPALISTLQSEISHSIKYKFIFLDSNSVGFQGSPEFSLNLS